MFALVFLSGIVVRVMCNSMIVNIHGIFPAAIGISNILSGIAVIQGLIIALWLITKGWFEYLILISFIMCLLCLGLKNIL